MDDDEVDGDVSGVGRGCCWPSKVQVEGEGNHSFFFTLSLRTAAAAAGK